MAAHHDSHFGSPAIGLADGIGGGGGGGGPPLHFANLNTSLDTGGGGGNDMTALLTEMRLARENQQQMLAAAAEQNAMLRQEISLMRQAQNQGQGAGHAGDAAHNQQSPPAPSANLAESNSIKGLVAAAVKDTTAQLNKLNAARQAVLNLEGLEIAADPTTSLPTDTPNACKKLKAPELSLPADMAEQFAEQLASSTLEIEKHLRAMQIQYCRELLGIKRHIAVAAEHKITEGRDELRTEITSVLADTLIPPADQQLLLHTALDKFDEEKRAVVIKIETARKEAAKLKAQKAAALEEAQVKQLTEDNSVTVGALIDSKIAAERHRRGSEDISVDDVDEHALMEENARFQRHLGTGQQPKNGKAKRTKTNGQKKSAAQKGKPGKGKGGAAGKRGGGRGGR